jgi:hypothetical protein
VLVAAVKCGGLCEVEKQMWDVDGAGASEELVTRKTVNRNDLEEYAASHPSADLLHTFSSMHKAITESGGRYVSPYLYPVPPGDVRETLLCLHDGQVLVGKCMELLHSFDLWAPCGRGLGMGKLSLSAIVSHDASGYAFLFF